MYARWAKALARWGLYWAKRMDLGWVDFGAQRDAVIIRYHSVSDATQDTHLYVGPNISLATQIFEKQLAFLSQHYHCLGLDDLIEGLESGRPLPRNAVVITFDDGYQDNYEYAYPLLRRYQVPAIFYLTTGCLEGGPPLWTSEIRYLLLQAGGPQLHLASLGQVYDVRTKEARERAIRDCKKRLVGLPRQEREEVLAELRVQSKADLAFLRDKMLRWSQVKEMRRGGMSFGAHTLSHPLLPSVPVAEAREEIVAAKVALEEQLKEPIVHFSYPNPSGGVHYNSSVQDLVAASRYRTAVTSHDGYVSRGEGYFALQRVRSGKTLQEMLWLVEREALGRALDRARGTSSQSAEK